MIDWLAFVRNWTVLSRYGLGTFVLRLRFRRSRGFGETVFAGIKRESWPELKLETGNWKLANWELSYSPKVAARRAAT